MRLTNEEQLAIGNTIHQVDADAMIYHFGSRVDDTAKGGDIDIAIYPDTTRPFPRMVIQTGAQL